MHPAAGFTEPPRRGIVLTSSTNRGSSKHVQRTPSFSSTAASSTAPAGSRCYRILRQAGHEVGVVQNPTLSLADDVAVTRRVLDQHERVILVGHSYGGAVITEAGNHPNVDKLVYIAAFAPDAGESVNTLIADPPPGAPVPPILPPVDGFLFLDKARVRRVVRCRRRPRHGRVHGRLAGALGRRRARRRDQQPRLAGQAELVPRRDRRPHDPARRPARHVTAGRLDRHRDRRQPRHLRLATPRPWPRSSPARSTHSPDRRRWEPNLRLGSQPSARGGSANAKRQTI